LSQNKKLSDDLLASKAKLNDSTKFLLELQKTKKLLEETLKKVKNCEEEIEKRKQIHVKNV
jgi:hypothetical protein